MSSSTRLGTITCFDIATWKPVRSTLLQVKRTASTPGQWTDCWQADLSASATSFQLHLMAPTTSRPSKTPRRRLTAIHKTAVKDLEENGIETLMAAIGLTTWQVDSGAPPNAPVILLPLDVEATGAVARDFRIEVAGDAHLAPVLSQILRVDHGMDAGPWVVFYHRRLARRLETPSFVLT